MLPKTPSSVMLKTSSFLIIVSFFQEALDKKMGGPFNVVVGESFSFDVAFTGTNFLYMYFGGTGLFFGT